MYVRNKTESYYNAHNFTYIYIAFKQSSITMLNNIINSNDKIESQLQQEDDDPFGLNTIYKILKHKPSSNNYLSKIQPIFAKFNLDVKSKGSIVDILNEKNKSKSELY